MNENLKLNNPTTDTDTTPPVDMDTTYPGDASATATADSTGSDLTAQARLEAERKLGEVKEFTRRAGDEARKQWEQARVKYEQSRGDLADAVADHRRNLTGKAQQVAEEQRGRVVGGISDIAAAARAAAEELDRREDPNVATYARGAADALDRVTDYVRDVRLDDLADEAAAFTRRRPEWVLGGLFVAGLAAARFLRADQPHARGLPAGADDELWQDAVDQQRGGHAPDYAAEYPRPGSPVGLHNPEGHLPPPVGVDTNPVVTDPVQTPSDVVTGEPAVTPTAGIEDEPKKTGATGTADMPDATSRTADTPA